VYDATPFIPPLLEYVCVALTPEDLASIAQLARLEIDPAEVDDYITKLDSILDLVAQLDSVDTSSVLPMAHPLNMVQRLRPDEVTESDHREYYQQNAADVSHGLYRVPRVIE
jgi:aspartyl-tRNA(Asn)/glutamyl-tRNA(Gln) amidotransferase subunit C